MKRAVRGPGHHLREKSSNLQGHIQRSDWGGGHIFLPPPPMKCQHYGMGPNKYCFFPFIYFLSFFLFPFSPFFLLLLIFFLKVWGGAFAPPPPEYAPADFTINLLFDH